MIGTYLGSEAVSNEEAVLDLDGTDHILGELGFHLLHHVLLHILVHLVLELHSVLGLVDGRRRLVWPTHPHILLLLLLVK